MYCRRVRVDELVVCGGCKRTQVGIRLLPFRNFGTAASWGLRVNVQQLQSSLYHRTITSQARTRETHQNAGLGIEHQHDFPAGAQLVVVTICTTTNGRTSSSRQQSSGYSQTSAGTWPQDNYYFPPPLWVSFRREDVLEPP